MDIAQLQARVDDLRLTSDDDALGVALGELVADLDTEGLSMGKEHQEAMEAQLADLRREVEEDKQAEKDHQALLEKLTEDVRKAGGTPI